MKLCETPTIGIICGSGLGDLGDMLENPQILPYNKIPGFPSTNGNFFNLLKLSTSCHVFDCYKKKESVKKIDEGKKCTHKHI